MLAMLVAATIVAPEPQFQDSWFSSYLDIPRTGLKRDTWTSMLIELTVNTQGTASGCEARVIEGNPNMARYTCTRLMSRARLRPARDASGKKVYGVYRTVVRWWNGSNPPKRERDAHFRFTTSKWIGTDRTPVVTGVRFMVDATGQITDCRPGYNDKREPDEPAEEARKWEFAPIACAEMLRLGSVPPARTRGGEPILSVQTATVRLIPSGS